MSARAGRGARARRRPLRRVTVEARAKLNLGLAVGPARVDGFHDLATVFQSVSLADTLVARPLARGFRLVVRHVEAARRRGANRGLRRLVPAGRGNLVLAAARALARAAGLTGGARFTLVKRVPARAGLGGGSADAAAALVALDALYRLRTPRTDLARLALGLGSDVPFALTGGTAVGFGRGERLRRVALTQPFRVVIVVPRWRISTAEAFREFDRVKYGLTRWRLKLRFAEQLARRTLPPGMALRLGNDFETVLGDHRAQFDALSTRMRNAGLDGVHLTGSGSALFGLIPRGRSADRIVGDLGGNEAIYVARSVRSGVRVQQLE